VLHGGGAKAKTIGAVAEFNARARQFTEDIEDLGT